MAVPQLPYESDPALRPPGDPGPLMGTLAEIPGVVGDAVGAYRDAEQGLARTLNSGIPLINLFPVPPEGQGSFLPGSAVPPPAPAPVPGAPSATGATQVSSPSDLQALLGGSGGGPDVSVANTVGSDVQRTQQVQNAGEKQAIGALGDVYSDRRALQVRQGEQNEQRLIEDARQTESENQRLDAFDTDASLQRVRMDDAVVTADKYLKQRRDAFSKDGIRSFYADSPAGTASLFASALFTGLGAWAQALGGGPNTAWMVLKDGMDRWENRERARLDQQLQTINMADRDVSRMEQRKASGMLEIANSRLALLENLKRQRLANAAKMAIPQERLANDLILNNINKEEAEKHLQINQGLRTTVQTSNATQQAVRLATAKAANTPTNLTESQGKASGQMVKAVGEVRNIMGMKPYNPNDQKAIEAWVRRMGEIQPTTWEKFRTQLNSLSGSTLEQLSPEGKRRFQAENVLGISLLRPETGAVVGRTEVMDKISPLQMFQSDTPQDIQTKAERRRRELESLAIQSGPHAGYWNQQINPKTGKPESGGGGPVQLSSQEAATLLKFVQENRDSADPAVRAKVDAAKGALSGKR